MAKLNKSSNLVWIDTEGNGLDFKTIKILEVGMIITDSNLNQLNQGISMPIHYPKKDIDKIFKEMDEWNQKNHQKTGLLDLVKKSKFTVHKAEDILLKEIKKYCEFNNSPLCGNSVHYDRRMIEIFFPKVHQYLHYRLVDVSSIKEIFCRWYPDLPLFVKSETHRALEDIQESIAELRYYRNLIFKS